MNMPLTPSPLKQITYADKGKSKVLGLGKVAISKDRHMDKVMLVESLGFNLMSVSMLCDLNMVVIFGKSSKVLGEEICTLLMFPQVLNQPHAY